MFVDQIFEECAEILGTTDEKRVYRKITQAVQTLMESGHWMQSTADVDVCTGWDGYTIALPRGIDVPLAVNVDGSPVYFRNRLFQYHVNKGGKFNTVEWAWDDRGYVATLMEIVKPSQLVAVAESENDVGKIIRLTGTDANNRDLRSQLKDGTGVDGLLIPIHSQSDFAYGTITSDDVTIRTREVAVSPINKFASTTPHTLDSGQGMAITAISGTIPVPLSNGKTYYIGVLDALTIQIHTDSLNAQEGNYPISLQSIVGAGPLKFLDSRTSFVVTALQFASAPTIGITSANPITFPSGQSLPIGIRSGVTYFGNLLDSTHLQIFSSISDAQSNINPVFITGSTNPINVDVRKEIVPETKLTFGERHYFNDADQVQAATNGGVLPKPLITNQNYFVNVIDEYSVSIHSNITDAINSTPTNLINPIEITTDGAGSNSIVKLIQSTIQTGTESQVTAPSLNISSPTGTDAQFQPILVGSVTSVNITEAGTGYTIPPSVVFSDPITPPTNSGYLISNKTAQGYATINTITEKVTGIVITDPGSGYSSPPTVTISGPTASPIIPVKTLTANGTLATCVTQIPHGFSNTNIEISGATPETYNGTFSITVTSPTSFTYTLSQSLGAPKAITALTSGTYIITSITQSGLNNPIVTTSVPHNIKVSDVIWITGAGISSTGIDINGSHEIFSVTSNTFSLAYGGTAVGTINVSNAKTWKTPYPDVNEFNPYGPEVTYATATCNGHGIPNGTTVFIAGAVPTDLNGDANGYVTVVNSQTNTFQYIVIGGLANNSGTATVFQYPALGTIIAKKPDVNSATAISLIQTSFISYYNKLNGGSGYVNQPIVKIIAGNGSGATAKATVTNGEVTKLTPITAGANYTGAASVQITPSTGIFINFSSTGSLPSPLSSGTTYRIETPLNSQTGNFTVKNLDFSDVDITSVGSGTFYTVLSRTFGVDFTNNWRGDFSNLTTPSTIYWGTDYLLPLTNPSIDNGITPAYLNVISTSVAKAYTSSADASAGGINGLISVVSLGTGQSYFAKRFAVSPLPYNNLIKPSNVNFLQENETVKFSTSGILPSPLVAGTDYQVKVVGDSVNVYSGGVLVPITGLGTGQLSLDIQRTFNASPSTSIISDALLYNTGQSITVRANSGDVLPSGLNADTTYFVRRIANNEIELYSTQEKAENLLSTDGRVSFLTSGLTIDSKFFVDAIEPPILVKSVANIQKPLTDGFVSLYAMDYGRSNDLTLIGQYHPQEVNPQYRRIRIGKPCAWARIAYRLKPPVITSKYDFIPIEHTRAIICGVHACDLEDKDFAEQALRYWGFALAYLKNQQEHQDGHAFVPPQINDLTYGDGTDPVMF
jgi:hypothetical protein